MDRLHFPPPASPAQHDARSRANSARARSAQRQQQQSMEVEVEKRDIGHYTHALLDKFKVKRKVKFSEVFDKSEGRYGMIGTLIAMLEMMKQGYLRAFQENCFDDISLAYTGSEEVTADLVLAGVTAEEMRADKEKAAAEEASEQPESGEPEDELSSGAASDHDESAAGSETTS